jgi:hypothetical protein
MSAPPPPPPPGVNMPKKKDPRMRSHQAKAEQPAFFDSADYEVKKQQEQDPERRARLLKEATKAPHATQL